MGKGKPIGRCIYRFICQSSHIIFFTAVLVVQFGWKEEIPVSFASSFCLNWTWCDSSIISTTLFLHLKNRSSSSSSFSSSLNQFEEMYPLRVMGAGGI